MFSIRVIDIWVIFVVGGYLLAEHTTVMDFDLLQDHSVFLVVRACCQMMKILVRWKFL